jgi:hypothetical protein
MVLTFSKNVGRKSLMNFLAFIFNYSHHEKKRGMKLGVQ